MHYYRFRTASELAIKELMYDEIYFSSTKECNDPYDGKAFLTFEADNSKWKRLVECAWRPLKDIDTYVWADKLSMHLAKISPLTYDAALNFNYIEALLALPAPPDWRIAPILGNLIVELITLYKPENKYFVSFSRINNNPLMWSHYASMHHGHCLIFKTIDGSLYQCSKRKKKAFSRNTRFGMAPSMSYACPERFSFQDIAYTAHNFGYDAFSCFPKYVFGHEINEKERIDLVVQKEQQYLEKHECWNYEQETRLILPTPNAWLFGEHFEYSQQERLLYYQPTQLVGVILGALMNEQQKKRFREIAIGRMDRITQSCDNAAVFDFVLFEAKLPDNRREIIIEPEEIFTLTGSLNKNDKNFKKHLNDWEEGWALVFNGNSGSRKKFE